MRIPMPSVVLPMSVVLFLGLLFPTSLPAQETDFSSMSLEELLDVDVSVVTKTKMTSREAPGVVTVVTAEEIAASGARDLVDVLLLVPGFQFGVDVQGVVGAGIRGLWGHEGKILLLVDGQEMNELLYSTLQFGNHFPVRQISRMEIIRGPGSAVYGGYAELAVVNIVTRSAADGTGFAAEVTAGEMADTFGRRTLDLRWAERFGDLSLSASAFVGEGNRSDGTYTDALGDSYDLSDQAELNPGFYNVGLAWKGLEARVLVDRYHMTQRDLYGENMSYAGDLDFDSWYGSLAWPLAWGDRLTITPKLQYRNQRPWQEDDEGPPYDKTASRLLVGATADWRPADGWSFLGGVEYAHDRGEASAGTDPADWFATGPDVAYDNLALFAQGSWSGGWANLTVGVRFEDHEEFGSSFVPRIGLTKATETWHVKLLAARAFRAPGLENIRLGSGVEPEETTALEVEAGWRFAKGLSATVNLFDQRIDEPIVYFVDPETEEEGYVNADRVGTRGAELDLRWRGERGFVTLGYSTYAARDNRVASYGVPGEGSALLGMARHKATLLASLRIGERWHLSPSLVHRTGRWAWTGYDEEGDGILEELDDSTLVNLWLAADDPFGVGVDLGVGVFDLTDEGEVFPQPYDSGHPPLPGSSRELVVRVGFRIGGAK